MSTFVFGGSLQPPMSGTSTTARTIDISNDDLKGLASPFVEESGFSPLDRYQLATVAAAGAFKDKKLWAKKVLDSEIRSHWLEEATRAPLLSWTEELTDSDWEGDDWDDDKPVHEVHRGLNASQLHEIVLTIQTWAENNSSAIALGPVPGTYIADDYVPMRLLSNLLQHIKSLEDAPVKDWHPGSDDQVLDLVHPSLFCLVYGISRRMTHQVSYLSNEYFDAAKACLMWGNVVPVPKAQSAMASKQFQWLPAEFAISRDGSVSIESYINNLHPQKHAKLYDDIAQIFQLFVPLFSHVLTGLRDAANNEFWHAEVVPTRTSPSGLIDLAGRQLQVIVKLANIHLTPDKPSYAGGTWHLEGMENENIIASGIYYYSQDNVTDSQLAFRFAVGEMKVQYEQNDDRGVMNRYGLWNDGPLNQKLGFVTTLEGRCLCFPNVYQHCVQPFELLDKSRPGHRKILVFFLVDPSKRVLSTADIPPQRLDWQMERVLDDLYADPLLHFSRLPVATKELIIQHLDNMHQGLEEPLPFTLSRAKAFRESLMEERKFCIDEQNGEIFERPFSLCEH